jgi:hypothetical protein
VTANVSATTGSAVTGVSTASVTVVSAIARSTGTFVTGVSITTSLSRVLGVALTRTTEAGQTILVLVMPSRA